jgi:hypothetical protein
MDKQQDKRPVDGARGGTAQVTGFDGAKGGTAQPRADEAKSKR